MKQVILSLFLMVLVWTSGSSQPTYPVTLMCYGAGDFDESDCPNCGYRSGAFDGIVLSYNNQKMALHHPIQLKFRGTIVDMVDVFGKKFSISTRNIATYNSTSLLSKYISDCKNKNSVKNISIVPYVDGGDTLGLIHTWNTQIDTMLYPVVTNEAFLSSSFVSLYNTDTELMSIGTVATKIDFNTVTRAGTGINHSLTTDTIAPVSAGNYRISFDLNCLPSVVGQIYIELWVNSTVVYSQLLNPTNVSTGWSLFTHDRVYALGAGNSISLRVRRLNNASLTMFSRSLSVQGI
jgi:hypothetical protein